MPCYCDLSNQQLDEVRRKIKEHAKAIVDQIKWASNPTSRYPELLTDTLKLIEHMYTGECDERDV